MIGADMNNSLFRLSWMQRGVLLFFAAILFFNSAQAAPLGEDLLHAAMNAERTISYTATETTTRLGAPTRIARVQQSGGKRRAEYSAPAIMRGDLLLDDGANLWLYHRAENSAVKTKTASRENDGPSSANRRDMKNLAVTVQARSTLAGRKAWPVTISSRRQKRVLRKIWIDEKTKARLRLERFDDAGNRVEVVALSNSKFGAVSGSAFQWKTPSGAEVSNAGTLYQNLNQARTGAKWLQVPGRLPQNYAFESAVVNSGEAWLRYSNGVRRFSIFQQRTKDSKSTPIKKAKSAWYWQQSGSRFLLAGLPVAQAKLVANSVR